MRFCRSGSGEIVSCIEEGLAHVERYAASASAKGCPSVRNSAQFLSLRDKSSAAKRYNQVEERATLKILPFQPPGDQHRAEVVYRVLLENLDALYRTAWRLTGRADLAEDLVQETARKALEAIPALTDARNTRAWLFRILLNGIRDRARRTKLWAEREADEATPDLNESSVSVE